MTPAYRPKLYTASKLHHALMWRTLRSNWPDIEFTSRWIEHEEEMETNASPADFAHYWTMDIRDVRRSDFCLCFAGPAYEPAEALKGAFVESGAALALGITVIAVNCPTTWSWTYHPLCVRVLGLSEAKDFLDRYVVLAHRGEYEGK